MMIEIKNVLNSIICGESLTTLKTFPDESVDAIITSPPYYGLRKYGDYEKQIGLEKTFAEYVQKILAITTELKRVLKPSGQLWWNMGDCYGTGSGAGSRDGAKQATNKGSNYYEDEGRPSPGEQKCLMMMPERIALKMIDKQGWILRNKIKWAKQILLKKEGITKGSVMPTSVKDRFNESGEELYFFVKNKKYYSDLDAVRLPNQVLGVTDFRASGLVRSAGLYPNSKYAKAEGQGKIDGRVSKHIKFNYDKKDVEMFNSPRARTQRNKVNDPRGNHEGGPGSWRDFKDENPDDGKAFNPLGKNLPTVWLIGSEPHNFQKEFESETDHFAIFPQALVEIPIKFGCPPNGIILDCFGGSGTVALMAKKLGRNYIGIELNKEYCDIANKRLSQQIIC